MSTTITRLYQTHQNAQDAVARLKKIGFAAGDINVVTSAANDTEAGDGSVSGVVSAILHGKVPKGHAYVYAEKVNAGATLVTVNAPNGTALKAVDSLKRFHPIDGGVADPDVYVSEDTGISTGLPKLMRGDARTVLLNGDKPFIGFTTIIKSGKPWFGGISRDGKPMLGGLASSKPTLPFPTIWR